jgi:hypothetical protein
MKPLLLREEGMDQNEETPKSSFKDRVAKKYNGIKGHVRKNQTTYVVVAAGVVVVTVTFLVTRRVYAPTFLRKVVIKDSVIVIQTYARRQGPPSYVVECVETGAKFVSQHHAAHAMKIDPSTLSRHLNGFTENCGGYHFVRLAMAIPRTG